MQTDSRHTRKITNDIISTRRRRPGFTLSEIMVVVVLISIVTSSVYSFYEIGARAHRSAVVRAESVSSMRFLQKLLIDKAARKSDGAYSAFMKKDGFASWGREEIESIMAADIHAKNEPLYRAAGYSNYPLHASLSITAIGQDSLKSKLPLSIAASADSFAGAYVYEATKEAAISGSENFKITFNHSPAKVFGASFLGVGNSAVISTNASDGTLEINTNNLCDLTGLIGPAPPVNVSFQIGARASSPVTASVFDLLFFFDSNFPPSESLSSNIAPGDIKKFFVESACVLCGDGVMFYEHDTGENFINHAIYLETPADSDAEYDGDGNKLKTVRYAMAKKENGEWKVYNDVIMNNAIIFELTYFDKNSEILNAPPGEWKWRYAPSVSGFFLEAVTSNGGIKNPMKMTFQFSSQ